MYVGVISSEEGGHFNAEAAILEKGSLKQFVVREDLSADEIGVLFQPLLVYLCGVLFF